MSNYTAEDFAQAILAIRGTHEFARRVGPEDVRPWRTNAGFLEWDGTLADSGWTPVVESRVTESTLRDSQEKADRKRQKLLDHIASLEAVGRRRNETIERMTARSVKREWEIDALRSERDELRKIVDELHAEIRDLEARPLTLDSLAAAWGAAEVPTEDDPIREGDEIICLMGTGGYLLRRASVHEHGRVPLPSVRVLSRAPQREPWQDLADALGPVIAEANGGEDQRLTDEWAQRLYERGVRVSKNEQE